MTKRGMAFYIARQASKLWKRITAETSTELGMLAEKWKFLLLGIIFQYIHGLAAHGVHYFHRPGPTLQDAGFMILPELGPDRGYVSQILRIATFMSTQLPGPNYHCREGSKFARLPPPESISEVLLINFPRGVLFGCGDLIFSSHMIFTLVFVRTYQKYGVERIIKQLAWISAVIQSLLIIASRKHYTVDVVVAWYTVNLVVYFVDKQLPEDERSAGNLLPLLPIIGKEKDARSKEELHRLVNGNSGDNPDRRPRGQINGKIMDNGTQILHMNPSTTE